VLSQVSNEGEQYPHGPQSESTAQLPPTLQMFALLSVDELRQIQGVFAPQFESVEHSSYEHPPAVIQPSASGGKQRPFSPPVHWESEEHVKARARLPRPQNAESEDG
jgi:hypothetical protein